MHKNQLFPIFLRELVSFFALRMTWRKKILLQAADVAGRSNMHKATFGSCVCLHKRPPRAGSNGVAAHRKNF